MTPTGEFIKVKKENRDYIIGQEITYSEQSETAKSYKRPFLQVAVATIMILTIFFTYSFYQRNPDYAFAYVALDINPSLNIEIDENLKVLDIEPFNSDGEIIKDLLRDWEYQNLESVTKMIFDYSKQQGFLKNEGEVFISIAFLHEYQEQNQLLKKEIEKQIDNISTEKELSINSFEITKEIHEHAKKEKTTPNKYAIVQSAHDAGISITIDEINEKSVQQINKELGNINILANGKKQLPKNKRGKIQNPSTTSSIEKKASKPQEKHKNDKQPNTNNKLKNEPRKDKKKVSPNENEQKQDKQRTKPNQEKQKNEANKQNKNKKENKKEEKDPDSNKPNSKSSNNQKEKGKEHGNSRNEAKGKKENN